jgi:mono/diheme cytochrome c family protein
VSRRLIRGATLALLAAGLALLTSRPQVAAQAQAPSAARPVGGDGHAALFAGYCISCHTDAAKRRGTVPVALDALDLSNVGRDAAVWEQVVLKMRAGQMPPAGAPRPDKAAHDAFVTRLEGDLDRAAAAQPNPGRTEPFHRLNRAEYRNAVRDLLGVDIDVSAMLPADDVSYGFDNIAGVLRLSPTLMERYLSAAQKIGRAAVGIAPPTPAIDYFRVADDQSQDVQLPGLPFGTRGGTRITYTFPTDGEYEFRPRLTRDLNESMPVYTEPQVLEISVDGERLGTFTLPGVTPAGAAGRGGRGGGRGAAPAGRGAAGGTGARGTGNAPPPADAPPPAEPEDPPDPQVPAISQIAPAIRVSAGDRQTRNRADESWNLRVPVKAGVREVVVTFVNRTAAIDETTRLPFLRPYPAGVNIPETRLGAYLRSVEIAGPFNPKGATGSPSRAKIFTCQPAQAAAEAACARTILTSLARRAYRRPVAAADVDALLAFYREGRADGGFDAGIERALRRLLVSPEFLFRVARDPAGVASGAAYRISDVDLASRLSFFLWSSIPDEELLALAEKRQLGTPAVLTQQVRRMLADPRADAFVTNFAGQWLFLRNLDAVVPVQSIFPDFDDTLRQAFRRETELFFDSIVRENRSALDLLRADYTFLNERLARHYGVPNVKGSHFRRVTLGAGSPRAGILGQGSVLTVTSYPDRTSPVVRGKWILENLLGTPPPPPIPDAGELRPRGEDGAVLSMRERMEQHRRNPVCASCHSMMDPLGLSLENFDAVGKWRTLGESSAAIDASGRLPDGTTFTGPAGLRDALLRSDRFVATLTEKLMIYALGRGVEYYDRPAVRAVMRDAARDDYRMASLIAGVVQSTPFRMRRAM